MFFETLKMVYGFHKYAWAKVTVQTTLKKVYLEKDKFSPSEQEMMEEMISQVNSKTSKQVSKFISYHYFHIEAAIGREVLDQKSKSNPLEASHKILDGRSERVVFESGQGKWASK